MINWKEFSLVMPRRRSRIVSSIRPVIVTQMDDLEASDRMKETFIDSPKLIHELYFP